MRACKCSRALCCAVLAQPRRDSSEQSRSQGRAFLATSPVPFAAPLGAGRKAFEGRATGSCPCGHARNQASKRPRSMSDNVESDGYDLLPIASEGEADYLVITRGCACPF